MATQKWDMTQELDSDAMIAAYLDAVFADGDPDEIRRALGHVARARGMSDLAGAIGISRAGIYKALAAGGNPSFATIAAILDALGVRLAVVPKPLA